MPISASRIDAFPVGAQALTSEHEPLEMARYSAYRTVDLPDPAPPVMTEILERSAVRIASFCSSLRRIRIDCEIESRRSSSSSLRSVGCLDDD